MKAVKKDKVYTFEVGEYELEEFMDALDFASEMVKLYEDWHVDAEWYDTTTIIDEIKQAVREANDCINMR